MGTDSANALVWSKAHANVVDGITGVIKQSPEDFAVREVIDFDLTGDGEHIWLLIEKRETNTEWLARQIAKIAGVHKRDVGYAGLKDRQAVTQQWFSIYAPRPLDVDWRTALPEQCRLLEEARHQKKLQRGALAGNSFAIRVRDIAGNVQQLEANCEAVKQQGVPNYFGEQRFGYQRQNISAAHDWLTSGKTLKNKHLRGLYLSAMRSWLFNHVLSQRVADHTWNRAIEGDVFSLDGSQSFFTAGMNDDALDDDNDMSNDIASRLAAFDIHPTGMLYGKGDLPSSGEMLAIEKCIVEKFSVFCEGLLRFGLKQQRRALRVLPQSFSYTLLSDNVLVLNFFLPAGSYATSLLDELGTFIDSKI